MKLTRLQVFNYRGLRDVVIPFSPFVRVIAEDNGAVRGAKVALAYWGRSLDVP